MMRAKMGSASEVDEVLGQLKMLERRAPRGNFVEIGKMVDGQEGGGVGRWVRAG
jgi:hypothetical protein